MEKKKALGSTSIPDKHHWIKRLVVGTVILFLTLLTGLTVVPAAFPAFGAEMADFLRVIFGPQPVAKLESTSFRLHDTLSRFLYKDGKPQITWSNPDQPETLTPGGNPKLASPIVHNKSSLRGSDVVSASPQIGWQAYGPSVNGEPVMARALVSPDSHRPYAAVALVRMDLSRLELHMMPGTLEPAHPAQLNRIIPAPGVIPLADQRVLAAFNGGFKAAHGHYGMMVDGVTLLPPHAGIATVAIYQDGHVQIGVWGKDILPSPDMIAFRQNCPPLLEAGQLNPAISVDGDQEAWGWTVNTDITWRTALGITRDGRYLIYAVGNGTSVATMAQVLQNAGAYAAMQLDINQYYAHFDTYQPVTGSAASQGFRLMPEPLLNKMIDIPHLYLTPSVRDFFYLSVHVPSPPQQKAAG